MVHESLINFLKYVHNWHQAVMENFTHMHLSENLKINVLQQHEQEHSGNIQKYSRLQTIKALQTRSPESSNLCSYKNCKGVILANTTLSAK